MLFAEKWYTDGSQNHAFRGIEMVEILNSTLSIPVRIFLKNTPRAHTLTLFLNACLPVFYQCPSRYRGSNWHLLLYQCVSSFAGNYKHTSLHTQTPARLRSHPLPPHNFTLSTLTHPLIYEPLNTQHTNPVPHH